MMTARWTDRRALQDAKDEQEARHVRITIAIRVAPRERVLRVESRSLLSTT